MSVSVFPRLAVRAELLDRGSADVYHMNLGGRPARKNVVISIFTVGDCIPNIQVRRARRQRVSPLFF
jgi:hypothetical protein